MNSELAKSCGQILNTLRGKIKLAQQRASWAVNAQMLQVCWEIGATITEQEKLEGLGAKTVERFSHDLRVEFPQMKGLSARNLRYMLEFAKACPNNPFLHKGVEAAGNNTPQSILQLLVAKLQVVENR